LSKVILLLTLLLITIGLQLLNPQLLSNFLDLAIAGGATSTLLLIACFYTAIALLVQVLSVGTTYFSLEIAWNSTNTLRSDLTAHCLGLDIAFYTSHPPGELIERIDGDVNALSNFFSNFALNILMSMLLIVGVLIVLYFENWQMGAVLTLYCLGAFFVLRRSRNMAIPHARAHRAASATLFGFIEERLRGLEDIRANGGGSYVMLRFFQLARDVYHKGWKAGAFVNGFTAISTATFACGYALALAMGVYLYQKGAISIGTVFLFFQYTILIRTPLEQISQELRDLQTSGASIRRVQELLEIQPIITDGPGDALPAGPLAVDFSAVTFAYDHINPVLQDISFSLAPGKVLGLVGRTGSGKTTISRLLMRLYDVTAGTVRVGDVNVRDTHLNELRQRVALVTQDVQLFQASVRDNVTLFNQTIPDERILDVFQHLGLYTWYATLPAGLDTEISNEKLSVGEAQLLAFARVFLRDPGVLILDEATSHLDPATQQRVGQAMDALLLDRTVIIIAHRLETLHRADDILILEQGHIKEYGSRQALADDASSIYASLLRRGMEANLPLLMEQLSAEEERV
jgi:ABC-type multidrug transport system fused ATPase/permease subunit